MKTNISILALLIGLFISTTAVANEPVPASKYVSSSVATYIADEMTYPEFAIKEKFEGDVVVKIIIEETGDFDVVAVNSHDTDMKEYVTEMIEDMETDKFDKYAGQSLLVKLSFDLRIY